MGRHALRQGPVVRALLSAGVAAIRSRGGSANASSAPIPGPVRTAVVPPRSPSHVRDYVAHCGGDPSAYRASLPAHLFPQWGFPLLAQTLRQIPYDLSKVLNGGCRIEIGPAGIPAGERLQLEACLEDIDDNGRRAVLKNRLTTSTASTPQAMTAWMYAVVPLATADKGPRRERPRVPEDAVAHARFSLTPKHAVDFALLTGDLNPIHWLRPYARMAGFRSTILHGFATLAYAVEALNRTRYAGDPSRLKAIDVKFTRPLVLPAEVGLYVNGDDITVGVAPGGPAYLTGTLEDTPHG